MTFTRAQAESLLNQAETGLYNDSRINSLRRLQLKEIDKRIERTRKARDRARDLLKKQKLASRAKSGSKRGAGGKDNERSQRKAELLADILKRFEDQRKTAKQEEKAMGDSTKKSARKATKKTATKTAKKAASKSPKKATKKAASTSSKKATKKASRKVGKQAAKKTAAKRKQASTGKSAVKSKASSKPISPKRALANTRKLLEAKQARERDGQPWQTLDPQQAHLPEAGYQSGHAGEVAENLHAAESRIPSIQGSISTRDRKNQGRRDRGS